MLVGLPDLMLMSRALPVEPTTLPAPSTTCDFWLPSDCLVDVAASAGSGNATADTGCVTAELSVFSGTIEVMPWTVITSAAADPAVPSAGCFAAVEAPAETEEPAEPVDEVEAPEAVTAVDADVADDEAEVEAVADEPEPTLEVEAPAEEE